MWGTLRICLHIKVTGCLDTIICGVVYIHVIKVATNNKSQVAQYVQYSVSTCT